MMDAPTRFNMLQCKTCGHLFAGIADLSTHMCARFGEKPVHWNIRNMNPFHTYNLLSNVESHIDQNPFHRQAYTKDFSVSDSFSHHMRLHTGGKILQSKIRKKTGEKPFPNAQSRNTFFSARGLTKRMLIDTAKEALQCEICNAHISNRADWLRHMSSHKGKWPFQCKICERRCSTKCQLSGHNCAHTQKIPSQYERLEQNFEAQSIQMHISQTEKLIRYVHTERRENSVGCCRNDSHKHAPFQHGGFHPTFTTHHSLTMPWNRHFEETVSEQAIQQNLFPKLIPAYLNAQNPSEEKTLMPKKMEENSLEKIPVDGGGPNQGREKYLWADLQQEPRLESIRHNISEYALRTESISETNTNLDRYFMRLPFEKRRLLCNRCGETFPYDIDLFLHDYTTHTTEN